MRERIFLLDRQAAYLEALEKLLQARIGWVNSAISPFAQAARLAPQPARLAPEVTPALKPAPAVILGQAAGPLTKPPRNTDEDRPDLAA
jgi:hypothetical protein